MANKKLFVERKFNVGIVESYKPNKDKDSPILGTFQVKGMTVENVENQNGRIYEESVWRQPGSFAVGGKFLDENGKLKPSTLFGSTDHPLDDRAEFLLNEGSLAWAEVHRNEDGSWDGVADILNNPNGRIVKTYLDYAKLRGGGHLLGVSSRALGESTLRESNGRQLEYIIPESFELMTFDFVYNPSFVTATATLLESAQKKNVLVESIRNLAKTDEDHKTVYESVAKEIEEAIAEVNTSKAVVIEAKEGSALTTLTTLKVRDEVKELSDDYLKGVTHNEFVAKLLGLIKEKASTSDEEWEVYYNGYYYDIKRNPQDTDILKEFLADGDNSNFIREIFKDVKLMDVDTKEKSGDKQMTNKENVQDIVQEDAILDEGKDLIKPEVKTEASDDEEDKTDEDEGTDGEGEEDKEDDSESADGSDESQEDSEEEITPPAEPTLQDIMAELSALKQLINDLFSPIENPEMTTDLDELEDTSEEQDDLLDNISDEDIAAADEDDLEYLEKLAKGE